MKFWKRHYEKWIIFTWPLTYPRVNFRNESSFGNLLMTWGLITELSSFACVIRADEAYEGWRDDAMTFSTLYEISRASQGFQNEIQEVCIISGVHLENVEWHGISTSEKTNRDLVSASVLYCRLWTSISAMNRIKSRERSKWVESILKALMLARSREGEFGHPEAFKGDKHRFVKEGRKEELFLQRFHRLNIVRACQLMIFREISKRFRLYLLKLTHEFWW